MSSLSAAFGLTKTPISAGGAAAGPMDGPLLSWPIWMQDPARQQDDYELKFEDIGDKIWRFRGEKRGRTMASHWPYDLENDVWRKVFNSYPDEVQNGTAQPAPDHHSGVFWRDIKEVRETIKKLEENPMSPYEFAGGATAVPTLPPALPGLRRADAEPGTH
jgi:hypothetical protein